MAKRSESQNIFAIEETQIHPARFGNPPSPVTDAEIPNPARSSNPPSPVTDAEIPNPARFGNPPSPVTDAEIPNPARSSNPPSPTVTARSPVTARIWFLDGSSCDFEFDCGFDFDLKKKKNKIQSLTVSDIRKKVAEGLGIPSALVTLFLLNANYVPHSVSLDEKRSKLDDKRKAHTIVRKRNDNESREKKGDGDLSGKEESGKEDSRKEKGVEKASDDKRHLRNTNREAPAVSGNSSDEPPLSSSSDEPETSASFHSQVLNTTETSDSIVLPDSVLVTRTDVINFVATKKLKEKFSEDPFLVPHPYLVPRPKDLDQLVQKQLAHNQAPESNSRKSVSLIQTRHSDQYIIKVHHCVESSGDPNSIFQTTNPGSQATNPGPVIDFQAFILSDLRSFLLQHVFPLTNGKNRNSEESNVDFGDENWRRHVKLATLLEETVYKMLKSMVSTEIRQAEAVVFLVSSTSSTLSSKGNNLSLKENYREDSEEESEVLRRTAVQLFRVCLARCSVSGYLESASGKTKTTQVFSTQEWAQMCLMLLRSEHMWKNPKTLGEIYTPSFKLEHIHSVRAGTRVIPFYKKDTSAKTKLNGSFATKAPDLDLTKYTGQSLLTSALGAGKSAEPVALEILQMLREIVEVESGSETEEAQSKIEEAQSKIEEAQSKIEDDSKIEETQSKIEDDSEIEETQSKIEETQSKIEDDSKIEETQSKIEEYYSKIEEAQRSKTEETCDEERRDSRLLDAAFDCFDATIVRTSEVNLHQVGLGKTVLDLGLEFSTERVCLELFNHPILRLRSRGHTSSQAKDLLKGEKQVTALQNLRNKPFYRSSLASTLAMVYQKA